MIYHWKALIKSSLNQEKNWAWHHPRDGHAHLTKKASLLLKPIWSLSWQKSFQFQYCFQLPLFRAFFWGMSLFSRTTGLEMVGRQSLTSGKPVVLEKSDIPQKKALNSGNWKQNWNWKDFCHERLQTSFSKSGAFSVRWAWPPPGWCHAQFLSWFKELYIRAFQWYIICFRILVGTCSKLQKHMNKNLPVWFHPILAVCIGNPRIEISNYAPDIQHRNA